MALFILALLQLVTATGGQQCLLASNGNRPLPLFERQSDNEPRSRSPIQAIIPSYRFSCCGVITGWGTFVERIVSKPSRFTVSFQVWRGSTGNGSCYYLTGVNRFPDIILPNVDEEDPMRGLINVTTPMKERIAVQPGDVVGVYFMSERSRSDGILLSEDVSYQESVWFETGDRDEQLDQSMSVCSAGRLKSTTYTAPLITATVEPTACVQSSLQSVTTTALSLTDSQTPSSSKQIPNAQKTVAHHLSAFLQPLQHSTTYPTSLLQSRTSVRRPSAFLVQIRVSASPSSAFLLQLSRDVVTLSSGRVSSNNTELALGSAGLTIGVALGASVLIAIIITVACTALLCTILRKRGSKLPDTKIHYVKDVHSSAIANNEAYGKFAQVSQTDNVYESVYTTQETASSVQGQVYSDSDYYTNEGLVGVADKPDSNPDPSIPTTENQAYTSVSADTERVRDEETYDYV